MENPYQSPQINEPAKTSGARLLGLFFFVLAAVCIYGATVGLGSALLTKLGFFQNVRLNGSLWPFVVESGCLLLSAGLSTATGMAFRAARYARATLLACVTLPLFVVTFYWR